jgi:hypothetical protein
VAMHQGGTVHTPNKGVKTTYSRDYRIFLKMLAHRAEIDVCA